MKDSTKFLKTLSIACDVIFIALALLLLIAKSITGTDLTDAAKLVIAFGGVAAVSNVVLLITINHENK